MCKSNGDDAWTEKLTGCSNGLLIDEVIDRLKLSGMCISFQLMGFFIDIYQHIGWK